MVLLPESLRNLKLVAKTIGLTLTGAYLNLDSGFDSKYNRKCIFNAGLIPNIQENPRNRKQTKRGRKRLFNEAIHMCPLKLLSLNYRNLHPRCWSLCARGVGVSNRGVGLRRMGDGAHWGLSRYA
jgi:hypothetical protein